MTILPIGEEATEPPLTENPVPATAILGLAAAAELLLDELELELVLLEVEDVLEVEGVAREITVVVTAGSVNVAVTVKVGV